MTAGLIDWRLYKHRAIGAANSPRAFAAPALFAVPPIRAQKLRLDHIKNVSERAIRR